MPTMRWIMLALVVPTTSITLNDMVRNYDDDRDGRRDANMNVEETHGRTIYTSKPSRREIQLLRRYRTGA